MDSERRMQTANLFQLITIASKSSHVSDKVGNANRHIGNVRLEKKRYNYSLNCVYTKLTNPR